MLIVSGNGPPKGLVYYRKDKEWDSGLRGIGTPMAQLLLDGQKGWSQRVNINDSCRTTRRGRWRGT